MSAFLMASSHLVQAAGVGCALVYNEREYDHRGWCVFESGVCAVVLAHLAQAKKEVAS